MRAYAGAASGGPRESLEAPLCATNRGVLPKPNNQPPPCPFFPQDHFEDRVGLHLRKNSSFNHQLIHSVPEHFFLLYFFSFFFSLINFLPLFCFSSLLWPSSALPATHNALLCSVSLSPTLELLCAQQQ